MKLSVLIPLRNEEETIKKTVLEILETLKKEKITYELVLVNDNSQDMTGNIAEELSKGDSGIKVLHRKLPAGFGRAVREGLENISGEAVVICMGDASDDPEDIIKYYRKLDEGYDCVFGSRFIKGSNTTGYPLVKLIFNRLGNLFIKYLFNIKYNDTSNAFKAYRRYVIDDIKPIVSNHFNITVEMPLKAISRGYSYVVIPIKWYGRTSGVSKHKLAELQRKYFFSIFYAWLEKVLLKDEIRRK